MNTPAPKVYAKCIKRRTPTFPSRTAWYFDFSPWGGGYLQCGNGPGGIILRDDGTCADIRTGEVYHDARFDTTVQS